MGNLLELFGITPAKNKKNVEPERFTRFEQAEERQSFAPNADKNFTRFNPQDVLVRPSPVARTIQNVAPHKPDSRPALAEPARLQSPSSDAYHLNSEAAIPLSVFSNALPQRFSEMRDQRELA